MLHIAAQVSVSLHSWHQPFEASFSSLFTIPAAAPAPSTPMKAMKGMKALKKAEQAAAPTPAMKAMKAMKATTLIIQLRVCVFVL